MDKVKLVYFEGCPEAKNVRAALLNAGVYDFEVIKQNELLPNDTYKKLSSPSVLMGEELVYGIRTDGEISSCTFDRINFVDEDGLVKRFRELKRPEVTKSPRNVRSIIGAAFSTLLVLKCPACIPGAVAFLSALGLGFLITPTVLKSVLVLLLLLTLSGFLISYLKTHRNPYPLAVAILFSGVLYFGRFHYVEGLSNHALIYASVGGLICVSGWDLCLKTRKECFACT